MEIKTLEGIDELEILDAFNESFSDYFIPFKLSEEQLLHKMKADKTDLSLSVGAFEDERLTGFILHGIDEVGNEKWGYNGGTGVIPERRGFGLTKQMYHFILPILLEKGVDKLILEVISKNTQAIKSYEKSGFITQRELLCYSGKANPLKASQDFEIKKIEDFDWALMESFWDILPTWQNSKSAINEMKVFFSSLGAFKEDQLIGYVVYNPNNQRIQQIAVDKNHRRQGIASGLFSELIKEYGDTFSIINVDKSSLEMPAFLDKLGLNISIEQLEMVLESDKK